MCYSLWFSVLSLELTDKEINLLALRENVLAITLDFPICPIHLNFSFSLKQGEVSQLRKTFSPKSPPRLSPGFLLSPNHG